MALFRRFTNDHALWFYVFHNIIHVFVGLPLSLLPSIWLCSAIIVSLPFSIFVTCPNHVSLLFLIFSIIVSFCSSFRVLFHSLILSCLDFLVFPAARSFMQPVASFHPPSSGTSMH